MSRTTTTPLSQQSEAVTGSAAAAVLVAVLVAGLVASVASSQAAVVFCAGRRTIFARISQPGSGLHFVFSCSFAAKLLVGMLARAVMIMVIMVMMVMVLSEVVVVVATTTTTTTIVLVVAIVMAKRVEMVRSSFC
jgi:hypothetical protein